MADLNKIKDKIARQHGYKNWFHMVSSKLGPYIPFDEVVDKYTQAHTKGLRERVKELEENLVYAIRAIKAVNSFGATRTIIDDLEKVLKK